MVYVVLRALLRQALAIFFRDLEVEGREQVPAEGPLLLASNHPNTLIDVLLVATALERRVAFVAKAPLFQHPVLGPILRFFEAVPVERKLDGPIDEAARRKNAQVLAACEERLAAGGAVLIFPEGTSLDEPRLQPLKTGAARIALGAERRAPGRVRVVPCALVYDAPGTFRSRARVRYGAPIDVAPFARLEADGADPFVAARALTEALRDALLPEVLHVEGDGDDALVRDLAAVYGSTVAADAGGRLAGLAAIARAVRSFQQTDPERVARVRGLLADYQAALLAAGVDDRAVRAAPPRRTSWAQDLGLVLGAPLALWGIVNHLVLYQAPRVILALTTPERVYDASVKLAVGFIGLFLTYALQGALVAWRLGGAAAALYLATLPVAGVVALLWLEGLEARGEARRTRRARARLAPAARADLEARRAALVAELAQARAIYLADSLPPAPEADPAPRDPAPPVPGA